MTDTVPTLVQLEATRGPISGQVFSFEQHDTLIFGRGSDCHARLPSDDGTVSRHHFLLEVNPPEARVRDLGSLNGTFVNDVRYGGREGGDADRESPDREVDLSDGDLIRAGATVFEFRVLAEKRCGECGTQIPEKLAKDCLWRPGAYVCPDCRGQLASSQPRSLLCQHCGRDVSIERTPGRPGHYACRECRARWTRDPSLLPGSLGGGGDGRIGETTTVELLSGYRIIEQLGRGSVGNVYRASRGKDGPDVALKLLFAKVAVNEYSRRAFQREIEISKKLRHPNIVELYDHGSDGSIFYSAMELCPGGSLQHLLDRREGKVPFLEAITLFVEALDGLAFAHRHGFVHRDIKPANILLTKPTGGVAKIADFGLAKSFVEMGLNSLTITGRIAGTLKFMPREQLVNFKYARPVSDVWSITATMYYLLTGTHPRDLESEEDPIAGILSSPAVPIRERERTIPAPIAEVIDRALAVDPEDRFADAYELRSALMAVM